MVPGRVHHGLGDGRMNRQLAFAQGQPDHVVVLALEFLGQFLHGEHSETLRQQSA
jgi:hypothetical protein